MSVRCCQLLSVRLFSGSVTTPLVCIRLPLLTRGGRVDTARKAWHLCRENSCRNSLEIMGESMVDCGMRKEVFGGLWMGI